MENNTTNLRTKRIIYAAAAAAVYLAASLAQIFSVLTDGSANIPLSSLLTGFPGAILSTLGLSVFLACTGSKGGILVLLPTAAALTAGFALGDAAGTLFALLGFLPYTAAAAIIYSGYSKHESKAAICAATSFALLVLTIADLALSVLFAAYLSSVSFSTMFFGIIDNFIESYITLYENILAAAAQMSPELASQGAALPDKDAIYSSFTLVFTIMPAIIYGAYFAMTFAVSGIVNYLNKHLSFIPDYRFERYNISTTTHVIFSVLGTILVFSLFFGSSLSAFICVLMCTVISILPHYIVFAYIRLHNMFSRFAGNVGGTVICVIVTLIGCFFSMQIFLCVLAFFGTSEYAYRKHSDLYKN